MIHSPGGEVEEEAVEVEDVVIDPYDMMDPVDIIPLMPKNFYEQIVCMPMPRFHHYFLSVRVEQ